MKVLFIGGTGLISTAVTKKTVAMGIDLYLLNRGNNNSNIPNGVRVITGDIYRPEEIKEQIKDLYFDTVVQWIAFDESHVKRDYEIFKGHTKQYIFISSASAYQKPGIIFPITENVPLGNPFWDYSQNKQRCEEYLNNLHDDNFNVTIVRPSHTYNDHKLMACVYDGKHPYALIKRLLNNQPIIIPGDGTSLWTITHNTDFAEAFVMLLGNKQTYGETYHITSDFAYTWEQLTDIIAKELDVIPHIVHVPTEVIIKYLPSLRGSLLGDKSHTAIFDNTKIKKIAPLFQATIRYEDVAAKAVKYFRDHPESQNTDSEFEDAYDLCVKDYTAFLNQ